MQRKSSARARIIRTFLSALLFAESFVHAASDTQPLPLDTFSKLPPIQRITLSGDGSKAVALRAIGDTYHAVLLDFTTGKSRVLMAADPENFLFNWCRFANDSRIVCSIRSYVVLKAGQIGAGYRAYRDGRTVVTRLLAINTDGSGQMQLVPESRSRLGGKLEWNPQVQDNIVSWLSDDPEHVLIQLARENRTRGTLYKLNIYTNRLKKHQTFSNSVLQWYADDKGKLLFATGYENSRGPVAFSYVSGRREMVDISHLIGINPPTVLGLTADSGYAWVAATRGNDTRGIHRINLATAKVEQTLFEHESFDATGLFQHPKTLQPVYAEYQSEKSERVWFDDDLQTHVTAIGKAAGNPGYVRIESADDAMNTLAVYTYGNDTHPAYYIYRAAQQSLMQIAKLDQGPPAQMQPISYTARDGLQIPAYLALPGPVEQGPYPTIIYPHGGPHARSSDEPWFITQYLVNHGYAVLQPNFRGSSGYGDAFMSSGFNEWGETMQDDVIDGLNWMIEQGYTEPKQACMLGGSYGGYVALVAAFKTPGLLRCAVSFAGVADLQDLAEHWYNYEFGRLSVGRIQSGDALTANSPIANVDKIGLPLLLVHGDVDRSVMIEQSRNLVKALDKAGKQYTYIEQANGDHFFSLQSHRLEFLNALDEFLGEHLPTR